MNPKYLNSKTEYSWFSDCKSKFPVSLAQVFEPRKGSYLNEFILFTTLFFRLSLKLCHAIKWKLASMLHNFHQNDLS